MEIKSHSCDEEHPPTNIPRAPEAQVYEEARQAPSYNPPSTHHESSPHTDQSYAQAADEASMNWVYHRSSFMPSVPNVQDEITGNPSSDSSETLVGDEEEDGAPGLNDSFNGTDGVIDTRYAPRNGLYHDETARGADVDNSLRIDEAGNSRLSSQWRVPSAAVAQANAGSTSSRVRVWPYPEDVRRRRHPQHASNSASTRRRHEPLRGRSHSPIREFTPVHDSYVWHWAPTGPSAAPINGSSYSDRTYQSGTTATNEWFHDGVVGGHVPDLRIREQHEAAAILATMRVAEEIAEEAVEGQVDDNPNVESDEVVSPLNETPFNIDVSMQGALWHDEQQNHLNNDHL